MFVLFYCGIVCVNRFLLFSPTKVTQDEYNEFCLSKKGKYIPYVFTSDDNLCQLHCGLYNAYKIPSLTDKIYFYSHGNSGWIGNIVDGNLIKLLSQNGSVFIYDYRGYGANHGVPTDIGLENDAIGAWNFLTMKLQVPISNIVVVGHSLGAGVSCRLLAHLKKNYKKLPSHLILNAPFSSIKDMAHHTFQNLAWLSIYEFDNLTNAKTFDNEISICILHSKSDETIPYQQSRKLASHIKCNFIEIHGKHNDQHYSTHALKYIEELNKN